MTFYNLAVKKMATYVSDISGNVRTLNLLLYRYVTTRVVYILYGYSVQCMGGCAEGSSLNLCTGA